ncbi:MAG TPA: HAD family phosphatase [Acidisarcina sp.]|nr:HAD family phosphatase [Acidisarcina sp.]
MNEISTILWDVGGVLLTNGWDHCERDALLQKFGLEKQAFEQRHAKLNDPWEKGLIPLDEYLQQVVFYQPRSFTPQEFLEAMKAESRILPDSALRILAELSASEEFKMAAVNNESRELNDYRIAHFDLWDYIDCFLSSCYVGLRKPDPKIYRLALDVLQRQPEEVVFIDDREENINAAAAIGIHGIRYTGSKALAMGLQQLGIEINAAG